MRFAWRILIMAIALAASQSASAADEERAGEIVEARSTVTGTVGVLASGAPVHVNEKLTTDATGLAQITFDDASKLVIGPNSSVVIDSFVYSGNQSVGTMALSALVGTFRWITGTVHSQDYTIRTPRGELSIRGTAFDLSVTPEGDVTVVLYEGKVELCNAGQCQTLDRQCNMLDVTSPELISSQAKVTQPVLSRPAWRSIANPRLLAAFQVTSSRCVAWAPVRAKRVRHAALGTPSPHKSSVAIAAAAKSHARPPARRMVVALVAVARSQGQGFQGRSIALSSPSGPAPASPPAPPSAPAPPSPPAKDCAPGKSGGQKAGGGVGSGTGHGSHAQGGSPGAAGAEQGSQGSGGGSSGHGHGHGHGAGAGGGGAGGAGAGGAGHWK